MMDWLESLAQNPFLSGGAILVVMGAILASLRHLPRRLYDALERLFLVRMEVQDDDESYQWMQLWLARRLSKSRFVSVLTRRPQRSEDDEDDNAPAEHRPEIHLVPAPGTYALFFQRRLILLTRNRDDERRGSAEMPGGVAVVRAKENFALRIFSRNRTLARQIVEECRSAALPKDGRIDVRAAPHGYWELVGRQRPRSLQSVILAGQLGDRLLADIREFQGEASWYGEMGIPYHRGYLLYGPPGNGKTSLVMALASELAMNVYLLNLSSPNLDDVKLMRLLMQVGSNSIILIEDVDCNYAKRTGQGKSQKLADGLTFSGLLNAIDGVLSQDGRIIFMTTNHREKLDPALIRPGRADVQVEIRNASVAQARRFFMRFYPKASQSLVEQFTDSVAKTNGTLSMAALQGRLQEHKRDPLGAVRAIATLRAYGPSGDTHRTPVEELSTAAARRE
jgi:chaperone BCS1